MKLSYSGYRFPIVSFVMLAVLAVASYGPAQDSPLDPKESMRRIRVQPNEQSKRIGNAINWEPDFASAIAKSNATGKPIFWYVPTLHGSFMDRKQVIDRYMLAGPFSWPDIIDVINQHYVPVRTEPTQQQQTQYQLVPYQFIEPGFVILDPQGAEKSKVDRITTIHPTWFRYLLTRDLQAPITPQQKSESLSRAWTNFQSGDYQGSLTALPPTPSTKSIEQCERDLLKGMALFRLGKHDQAKSIWDMASKRYPNHPLAWKAAAESQGIGPFMRGFEVHRALSKRALNAGIESTGSTAPRGAFAESELWVNGIRFLLGMQNEQGGFTDSDYDFGGTDSLPNVHVAVTSLAGMALLRSLEKGGLNEPTKTNVRNAIRQALQYVTTDSNINKFDREEILWAYAYRVRFLSSCIEQKTAGLDVDDQSLKNALAQAVTALEGVQSKRGGWYHEYNNPFVTATALTALRHAQQAGANVDLPKVQRGLQSLSSDRFKNGAYPYYSRVDQNDNRPEGDILIAASAGRMPLCELGLWYWDQSTDPALHAAIERSLSHHKLLNLVLKYDDHTSRLAYGGFFFWYDMHGRSEAIAQVKDPQRRAQFTAQQKSIIMALPELDGCFVDSHELGRVYGTAMALLNLAYCN